MLLKYSTAQKKIRGNNNGKLSRNSSGKPRSYSNILPHKRKYEATTMGSSAEIHQTCWSLELPTRHRTEDPPDFKRRRPTPTVKVESDNANANFTFPQNPLPLCSMASSSSVAPTRPGRRLYGKRLSNITAQNSASISYSVRDPSVYLEITSQPEQQHRARYQTEGSRGAVKDKSGNGFPVVKLVGYNGPATLEVFIGTDQGKIAPHMFYQACRVAGKNSTPCLEKKTDGTVIIDIDFDPSKDMSVTCDCVGILKERNVDVEQRFPEDSSAKNKKRSTRCRMVFRTTIIHPGTRETEVLQVASHPIMCNQPPGVPEICKKSLTSCPVTGGAELFILGKNFLKDTQVKFQKMVADICQWEESVLPDKEFLQQSHLVCKVPPYEHLDIKEPVTVSIRVVSSDRFGRLLSSERQAFVYTPDTTQLWSTLPPIKSEPHLIPPMSLMSTPLPIMYSGGKQMEPAMSSAQKLDAIVNSAADSHIQPLQLLSTQAPSDTSMMPVQALLTSEPNPEQQLIQDMITKSVADSPTQHSIIQSIITTEAANSMSTPSDQLLLQQIIDKTQHKLDQIIQKTEEELKRQLQETNDLMSEPGSQQLIQSMNDSSSQQLIQSMNDSSSQQLIQSMNDSSSQQLIQSMNNSSSQQLIQSMNDSSSRQLIQSMNESSPQQLIQMNESSPQQLIQMSESSPQQLIQNMGDSSPPQLIQMNDASPQQLIESISDSSSQQLIQRLHDSSSQQIMQNMSDSSPQQLIQMNDSSPQQLMQSMSDPSPQQLIQMNESSPQQLIQNMNDSSPQQLMQSMSDSSPQQLIQMNESSPQQLIQNMNDSSPQQLMQSMSESSPQQLIQNMNDSNPQQLIQGMSDSSSQQLIQSLNDSSSQQLIQSMSDSFSQASGSLMSDQCSEASLSPQLSTSSPSQLAYSQGMEDSNSQPPSVPISQEDTSRTILLNKSDECATMFPPKHRLMQYLMQESKDLQAEQPVLVSEPKLSTDLINYMTPMTQLSKPPSKLDPANNTLVPEPDSNMITKSEEQILNLIASTTTAASQQMLDIIVSTVPPLEKSKEPPTMATPPVTIPQQMNSLVNSDNLSQITQMSTNDLLSFIKPEFFQ
ncbi:nuclear factor of activated T-cells 5 [Diaphorina citri]|uniref:Nuclear factor of activated T-cells 5 n=1 Tax=Diaphorina citri TaxID=121845 RepID=A0A3Q0JB01_DIACI|nr:nuclear factor of activated T-cells 5 [Diaphorina citri]